jgi:hypothetical protein
MIQNLKRFSAYLHVCASPKMILFAFLAQVIFAVFIVPYSTLLIDPFKTQTLFELRFGYNLTQSYVILDAIGSKGRNALVVYCLLIDILYALVYSISFSMLLSLFFRNSFSRNHYFNYFNVFPFLIAIADIFENLSLVFVTIKFPEKIEFMVKLASSFSLIKWGFMLYNLLLLLTGLFGWILKIMITRKR